MKYITVPGWDEDISQCTSFDQLPENAQNYCHKVGELVGVPVGWVGVGPARLSMLRTAALENYV